MAWISGGQQMKVRINWIMPQNTEDICVFFFPEISYPNKYQLNMRVEWSHFKTCKVFLEDVLHENEGVNKEGKRESVCMCVCPGSKRTQIWMKVPRLQSSSRLWD